MKLDVKRLYIQLDNVPLNGKKQPKQQGFFMIEKKIIKVLGQKKFYVYEEVAISSLKRGNNRNIKKIFQEAERERLKAPRKNLDSKPFNISVNSLTENTNHFSKSELLADSHVTYVASPFCEMDGSVFYNDDHLDFAKKRKDKTILVRRFLTSLSDQEKFAIQLRYCTKESPLDTMARMEAIRFAIDSFGWTPQMLNELMVKDKGVPWSTHEIKKEYLVGKVYEEFCDYEIQYTHDKLTPKSFSFLKALMRSSEIKKEFFHSREKMEHFVNIAIHAANNPGIGRLEDHITKILKHKDTKETFFTKGFLPAVEELKSKYPDSDKGTFPEFDFVNGLRKLSEPSNISYLQKHITKNPNGCKTFNALMDSFWILAQNNPTCQRALTSMLVELNSDLVATVLREKGHIVKSQIKLRIK